MTDEELAEMYSSTVKLCQDNKINAKNTWSLNLIDYMGMLVKDTGEEDALAAQNSHGDTNFQMAGVTLDAGVRIYCSRVDSVHTNAFKVLGSLSRTGKNEKNGNNPGTRDEDDEPDGEQPSDGEDAGTEINRTRKRPGKRKGESTLESNSAVLLQPASEAVYFDPLFQKMSAAFDEGGAKGMLLNNLCVNRLCEIVFDSSEPALEQISSQTQEDHSADKGESSASENTLELPDDGSVTVASYDVSSILPARDPLERPELCPRFIQFYRSRKAGCASQLESNTSGAPALNSCAPENEHAGDLALRDDDDSGAGAFDLMSSEVFLPDIPIGDDDDDSACILTRFDDCNEIIRPEVGRLLLSGEMDLMEAGVPLACDSEYSFFDAKALRNWAGPQHWHFRAIPLRNNATASGSLPTSNRKRGKTAMLLDFKSSPNFDFAAEFERAKDGSCQLSTAVRDGFSEKKVTLPEDLQYKTETLATLFLKPMGLRNLVNKNRVSNISAGLGTNDDQSSCWYSFDNEGDADNYCGADGDEEPDDVVGNPDDEAENAEPSGPRPVRHAGNDWGVLDEPVPRETVDIDFGIIAKEVDVKRLQSGIWKQIQGSLSIEPDSQEANRDASEHAHHRKGNRNTEARRETTLTHLVQAMPSYVPNESIEDITLPYIFICLLHLANEKSLSIKPAEDGSLGDLVISKSI
jgi:condensin complex subunit 2